LDSIINIYSHAIVQFGAFIKNL